MNGLDIVVMRKIYELAKHRLNTFKFYQERLLCFLSYLAALMWFLVLGCRSCLCGIFGGLETGDGLGKSRARSLYLYLRDNSGIQKCL